MREVLPVEAVEAACIFSVGHSAGQQMFENGSKMRNTVRISGALLLNDITNWVTIRRWEENRQ